MPSRRQNQTGPVPPADPIRFEQAVRAFRRKDPITDDAMDVLDASERERSFWVAGVAEADVVQQLFDAMDAAIEKGTPLSEFRKAVEEPLFDAWGFEDSPRLETVFRTNIMTAQNAGRYEIMTAPTVLDARPFWRLETVEDDRQSDICSEFNDPPIVLPADDPFWKSHHPPLHHNCRDEIAPLTAEEAADEGLTENPPEMDPAEGFGAPPSVTGEDWVPDLSGYDDEIAAIMRDRLDL